MHQLSVGPESTTALMTAATLASVGPDRVEEIAVALALAVALVCLLGWAVRVSFVAELFSRPVLVGYMAGVAVLMVLSSLPKLTGVAVSADRPWAEAWQLLTSLGSTHAATCLLGGAAVVVMVGLAWWRPHAPVSLLGIVLAAVIASAADLEDRGVAMVGEVAA